MKYVPIMLLILVAFAISLGSCVNEVKTVPPKMQDTSVHGTLLNLAIVYFIPDSNNILTVNFHASLTPRTLKNYRLEWTFGDSTGIEWQYDTSNISHTFKDFGLHKIILTVIDTQKKIILGRDSIATNMEDYSIDTNFLHKFTRMSLLFMAKCLCPSQSDSIVIIQTDQQITWQDRKCSFSSSGFGGTSGSEDNGEILMGGNNILSGFFKFWGYSGQFVGQHTIEVNEGVKYIEFRSPIKFINKDSIVFLCSQEMFRQI